MGDGSENEASPSTVSMRRSSQMQPVHLTVGILTIFVLGGCTHTYHLGSDRGQTRIETYSEVYKARIVFADGSRSSGYNVRVGTDSTTWFADKRLAEATSVPNEHIARIYVKDRGRGFFEELGLGFTSGIGFLGFLALTRADAPAAVIGVGVIASAVSTVTMGVLGFVRGSRYVLVYDRRTQQTPQR